MKTTITIFFLLLSTLYLSATPTQATLSGKLTDASSGKPIKGAHIFLHHTNFHTKSDSEGHYRLIFIPGQDLEVIICHANYRNSRQLLEAREIGAFKMDAVLKPILDAYDRNIVQEKQRKKLMKQFKIHLLGYTKNADKCNILNPEVLDFEKEKEGYRVYANDLLEIDNQALGYKLFCWIGHFEIKELSSHIRVYGYFEHKIPTSIHDLERWEHNRTKAYLGSPRHFFSALNNHRLAAEGFKVYEATRISTNQFFTSEPQTLQQIIILDEGDKYLKINKYLQISYLNEKDELMPKMLPLGKVIDNLGTLTTNGVIRRKDTEQTQISYLKSPVKKLALTSSGIPKQPDLFDILGYWSYESVADWLPLDYLPLSLKK